MLYEIQNTKQIEGEGIRRWFTDQDFDLIIWYTDDKMLDGFQLCYDKQSKERCITWRKSGSYVHTGVDDGEQGHQTNKMSPILVADGLFDKWSVSKEFKLVSKKMDPVVANFVHRKLVEFDGT